LAGVVFKSFIWWDGRHEKVYECNCCHPSLGGGGSYYWFLIFLMQCQHQKRAGLRMNNHSNWVQYLCGKMKNAWRAFDKMPSHCVVYCGTGTCEMQTGSECRRQKFDKCNRRYEASLCHFHKGSEMSRE
jgi:hypothetical protein